MNWWTSIVFYLWRNSFRRWIEQPLGVLSKWVIAALIGMLGAVMIAGTSFIGDELERQLSSRDALSVSIMEIVPPAQAGALFSPDDNEEAGWEGLAEESLTIYQVPATARIDGMRDVPVSALRDPEAHGYPDTVILLTTRQPAGTMAVATIDALRVEALAMPPSGPLLEKMLGKSEMLVASIERLAPLLQKGFTRQVLFQARTLDTIESAHQVSDTLQAVEQRRVNTRSSLVLLRQLREIRDIQGYVLFAVTIGTALVLGLICGALAWMEFREERYLLALIRSFGVGRVTLLVHAVIENCLVAVTGVLLGLALLSFTVGHADLRAMKLGWLSGPGLVGGDSVWVLLLGACCGGLLSCVPVGIGLRKPLGLVLK